MNSVDECGCCFDDYSRATSAKGELEDLISTGAVFVSKVIWSGTTRAVDRLIVVSDYQDWASLLQVVD